MIARDTLFALAKTLEGIPVLGALNGTPAARAGIGYGDILISVNGMRTRTVMEYVEAKALRSDGMDIVVFRAGAEKLERLTYDASPAPIDPETILSELVHLRIAPEGSGWGKAGGSSPPGS